MFKLQVNLEDVIWGNIYSGGAGSLFLSLSSPFLDPVLLLLMLVGADILAVLSII